jgi:hypothetical protein
MSHACYKPCQAPLPQSSQAVHIRASLLQLPLALKTVRNSSLALRQPALCLASRCVWHRVCLLILALCGLSEGCSCDAVSVGGLPGSVAYQQAFPYSSLCWFNTFSENGLGVMLTHHY